MLSNIVGKTRRQTMPPPPNGEAKTKSSSRNNSIEVSPAAAAQGSPYGTLRHSSSRSSLASVTRDKKRPLLQRALSKVVQPSQEASSSQGSLVPQGDGEARRSNESTVSLELVTTQKKLAEATDQCSTLQSRIDILEKESKERESQVKLAEEAANEERIKLAYAHAADMEAGRQEAEELQRSLEDLRRESKDNQEKMEVLAQRLAGLEEQLRERDESIQQLRTSEDSTRNALTQYETAISEKDKAMEELERKNMLLGQNAELLQKQIIEMEGRGRGSYRKELPSDESGFFSALWKWFSGPHS